MKISVLFNPESCSYLSYEKDYIPKRNALIYGGNIEAESLEQAWKRLQHIDSPSAIPNQRSLSVGDVLQTPHGFYVVRMVGYQRLNWQTKIDWVKEIIIHIKLFLWIARHGGDIQYMSFSPTIEIYLVLNDTVLAINSFSQHTLNVRIRSPIWVAYIDSYQDNDWKFAKHHTYLDYDNLPE